MKHLSAASVDELVEELKPVLAEFPLISCVDGTLSFLDEKSVRQLIRCWISQVDIPHHIARRQHVHLKLINLLACMSNINNPYRVADPKGTAITALENHKQEKKDELAAIEHLKKAALLLGLPDGYFFRDEMLGLDLSDDSLPYLRLRAMLSIVERFHVEFEESVDSVSVGTKFSENRWAIRQLWKGMGISKEEVINSQFFPNRWIVMRDLLGFVNVDIDSDTIKKTMNSIS